MSTGNVLPGIWKMGTLPKNAANLSESIVADVTMSFRSVRRDTTWQETVGRSEENETIIKSSLNHLVHTAASLGNEEKSIFKECMEAVH